MTVNVNTATSGGSNGTAPLGAVPPAADSGIKEESILNGVDGMFNSVRQVVSDFLELVALEIRHAGTTLMWMVAWAAIATVLIVAAWIGFMAALAVWAVSLGLPWIAAIAGVAVINLIAAAVILSSCIKMSSHLMFSATRRQLAAGLLKVGRG